MTWSKMRNIKKQTTLLFVLSVLFIFNQSCQSFVRKETVVTFDESFRIQHAQELLKADYKTSIAKQFEGDQKFASYLERYIASENAKLNSAELSKTIIRMSEKHSYDPVFLLAIMKTESGFNPNAIGAHGEIGLMQIKPKTAAWITVKKKMAWKGSEALKNPSYNTEVGALYFEYLKKSLKSKESAHYINAYNLGMASLYRLPASERISHPYYDKVYDNYLAIYQKLQKMRQTI